MLGYIFQYIENIFKRNDKLKKWYPIAIIIAKDEIFYFCFIVKAINLIKNIVLKASRGGLLVVSNRMFQIFPPSRAYRTRRGATTRRSTYTSLIILKGVDPNNATTWCFWIVVVLLCLYLPIKLHDNIHLWIFLVKFLYKCFI